MAIKPIKGKLVIGLTAPVSLKADFPEIDINQFKLNESLNLAIVIETEEEFDFNVKQAIKEAFEFG
ncbi:MAG: hypothetical protein KTR26_15530 [Flammeovirgaceae bacterium]|nr:hypothetical protein [Flammeovirgaceae bacterium]